MHDYPLCVFDGELRIGKCRRGLSDNVSGIFLMGASRCSITHPAARDYDSSEVDYFSVNGPYAGVRFLF
jgi:hypothetical protein